MEREKIREYVEKGSIHGKSVSTVSKKDVRDLYEHEDRVSENEV